MLMRYSPITTILAIIGICSSLLGEENDEWIAALNSGSGRKNGVELRVSKASQIKRDLKIDWTLTYDGPRPPLIILEPSLQRATNNQTTVVVVAQAANGQYYEQVFASAPSENKRTDDRDEESNVKRIVLSPRTVDVSNEWFVTIPAMKSGSGTITIPEFASDSFVKWWPKAFEKAPESIMVQVIHAPIDRGVFAISSGSLIVIESLDAWTGSVKSRLVRVEP